MLRFSCRIIAIGMLALWMPIGQARAQAPIRFPTAPQTQPQGNSIGGGLAPSSTAPGFGSATIGAPTFDPYATGPNAASSPPTLFGGSPTNPAPRPTFGTPASQPGAFGSSAVAPYSSANPTPNWPTWTDPSVASPGSAFPNTGYPPAYQQQPSVLFPNGMAPGCSPNWQWPQPQEGRYLRLFQDLRVRHTWLMGGEGRREMGVDETEIGTTVNFPNFLWSSQPLQVSPVFAVNWWDGPETVRGEFPTDSPAPGPFGTPPQVYAASLGFGWQPHIAPQFWLDLETSIGVYTDFEGFTADSVRIQGTGLGVLTLTPTITLKLGATYLDRVDIKLLPAGGVVWTPNPQTRWDIYFPRPKLARYLTTIGNTDIWFYLNGEYGGGSWTIGEAAVDRRMDMNDIRVGGGLEWTHQFGLQGFVETAYVFDRELVFAHNELANRELTDTLMVRGGLAY